MRIKQLIRKILACCGLIIVSVVVVAAFITATSYTQLAVAIIIYPFLIYFVLKAFPRTTQMYYPSREPVVAAAPPSVKPAEIAMPAGPLRSEASRQVEPAKSESMIGISDIDKRVFLKLIGGAGLSLFLFSIFNKKSEGLFFKNLPASGAQGRVSLEDIAGNKIDPAQSQPMDGYRISEIDDNLITFYGFTNKDGAWFIMKEDTDVGSFRYTKGDSNFPGSWPNREKLRYDYFNNVF